MDEIINKNKFLLTQLKDINKNLLINTQLDKLLIIRNQIIQFDNEYKQMIKLVNICKEINDNNKELFNCNILNIKNKLINNTNNLIKDTELYVDYKSIIPEIQDNQYDNILKIPVIYVNTEDDIKNTPLYYIKDKEQFGLKINNNIITGNIGNIFNKSDNQKNKTKKCHKLFCNKDNCYFYHTDRNFMNYSWIYSTTHKTQPIKKINGVYQFVNNDKNNTRLLGSRDTILTDLLYTDKHEKNLRNSQLMHDILIYQILSNYLH